MVQGRRWNWIDLAIWSVIAYVASSQIVNFAGRAASPSFPSLFPYGLSVLVASLGTVVLWERRRGMAVNLATALLVLGVVVGADLLAAAIAGKILTFALFGLVPIAAWRYARAVVPARTWLLTGAAFGLVIILVSRGMFSFLFIFPPLALVSFLTAFHEAIGSEVARALGLLPSGELSDEAFFFRSAPVGGIFWGFIYGLIGYVVDWWREKA